MLLDQISGLGFHRAILQLSLVAHYARPQQIILHDTPHDTPISNNLGMSCHQGPAKTGIGVSEAFACVARRRRVVTGTGVEEAHENGQRCSPC